MASILLALLIIIFIIIIVLLSFGTYVLSTLLGGFINLKNLVCQLMGWNKDKTQSRSSQSSANKSSSQTSSARTSTKGKPSASDGKMFDRDEGTYIDFEEVK